MVEDRKWTADRLGKILDETNVTNTRVEGDWIKYTLGHTGKLMHGIRILELERLERKSTKRGTYAKGVYRKK